MERPESNVDEEGCVIYFLELRGNELIFRHGGTGRCYISHDWMLMREALLLAAKIYLGGADDEHGGHE